MLTARVLALPVALLLGLATCARGDGPWPDRFAVRFDLRSSGTTFAETRWSLTPLGDGQYVYESDSATVGLFRLVRNERIVERSRWRLDQGRLQSMHYRYARSGRKRKEVVVDFDWSEREVRNTVRGDSWTMSVPIGTLDKLNYLLALMRDLPSGRDAFEYAVADGGKLKTYRFVLEEREILDTALGPLETLRVLRVRDPDSKRETVLWCAPALRYLPVQARHVEKDGTVVTWHVSAVEGL